MNWLNLEAAQNILW